MVSTDRCSRNCPPLIAHLLHEKDTSTEARRVSSPAGGQAAPTCWRERRVSAVPELQQKKNVKNVHEKTSGISPEPPMTDARPLDVSPSTLARGWSQPTNSCMRSPSRTGDRRLLTDDCPLFYLAISSSFCTRRRRVRVSNKNIMNGCGRLFSRVASIARPTIF